MNYWDILIRAVVMKVYGRKSLQDAKAYTIDFDYQRLSGSDIVKVDANEFKSVLTNDAMNDVLSKLLDLKLELYPDATYSLLSDVVSSIFGLPRENIIIGNGSDEILKMLFVAYFGGTLLLPDITYPVYRNLAAIYEMDVVSVPLSKQRFDLPSDIGDYFNGEKKICIAIFSYPNNPTGNCFEKDAILKLIKENPNTLFVVDEAYYEFCNSSFFEYVSEYGNLIVIRTFSKAYALAGLRLGFAVSNEDLITVLKKLELPYNINTVSQCLGAALIKKTHPLVESAVSVLIVERTRVLNELRRIGTVKVYHSDANFVFIGLGNNINVTSVNDIFRSNDIYIRLFKYPDLGVFMRFTISECEQKNNRVIKLIEQHLGNEKTKIVTADCEVV